MPAGLGKMAQPKLTAFGKLKVKRLRIKELKVTLDYTLINKLVNKKYVTYEIKGIIGPSILGRLVLF